MARRREPEPEKSKESPAERARWDRDYNLRCALSWVGNLDWLTSHNKLDMARGALLDGCLTICAYRQTQHYWLVERAMAALGARNLLIEKRLAEQASSTDVASLGEPIRTPEVVFEIVEEVTDDWRER